MPRWCWLLIGLLIGLPAGAMLYAFGLILYLWISARRRFT